MSKKITYPKFEINKSRKDHLFYWVLYSRNGKPILRSKAGYKTKQNAQKNIALVLKYGDKKDRYLYDTANISGNGFYFWLYGFKQFKMRAFCHWFGNIDKSTGAQDTHGFF